MMIFRRKPREGSPPDTFERYGHIAQEIGKSVAALNFEAFADGANPLPALFEKVDEQQRSKRLFELFSQLPAEQRLALLEATFQDDEFRAALASERERAVAHHAFADSVEQLVVDGRRYKRLDLQRVPDGAIIHIGLYDKPSFKDAGEHTPTIATCYRSIKAVARPDGTQMIREDTCWEGHGSSLMFEDNEIARIGTKPVDGDGVDMALEPMLYRGSPLSFVADQYHTKGPVHKKAMCGSELLVIGQIGVGDQFIFRE